MSSHCADIAGLYARNSSASNSVVSSLPSIFTSLSELGNIIIIIVSARHPLQHCHGSQKQSILVCVLLTAVGTQCRHVPRFPYYTLAL